MRALEATLLHGFNLTSLDPFEVPIGQAHLIMGDPSPSSIIRNMREWSSAGTPWYGRLGVDARVELGRNDNGVYETERFLGQTGGGKIAASGRRQGVSVQLVGAPSPFQSVKPFARASLRWARIRHPGHCRWWLGLVRPPRVFLSQTLPSTQCPWRNF